MKKTINVLGFIFFVLTIGCAEKQKKTFDDKYTLNGELEGIENGTWIYIMFNNKALDSAQVLENKFTLSGELKYPKQFDLYIKNTQNYTQIWLEPKTIGFKAKNGKFDKAKISGSKSQIESEKLWKPIWEYRKRRDSLSKLISNDKINDSIKAKATIGYDKVKKNRLKIEKDFIKNNPNSYVSASTLDFYSTSLSRKTVSELYNNFSENIKNSIYGQSVKKFLKLNKNLKIGDKFIDFSMNNEINKEIKLSDFEGGLVLLDFWASWCGPCIDEYPALKKAYSKFKKDGFEIVSISEDRTKERWLKAIEKNKLNWVNLWQEDGNKADPYLIYGINGIPDNFLINENGIIVARNLRGNKLISEIETNIENNASR